MLQIAPPCLQKEKIMKNLKKSWKLIALFTLGAIVCVVFVGRSRASDPTYVVGFFGVAEAANGQSDKYEVVNLTKDLNIFEIVHLLSLADGNEITTPFTLSVPAQGTSSFTYFPALSAIVAAGGITRTVSGPFRPLIVLGPFPNASEDASVLPTIVYHTVFDPSGNLVTGSQASLTVRTKDSTLNDQKSVQD
jgi:hypothetical protein